MKPCRPSSSPSPSLSFFFFLLNSQTRKEGESVEAFANRVQALIAQKARLKVAPWDGYLKYYNLAEKHPDLIENQRRQYSAVIKKYAEE